MAGWSRREGPVGPSTKQSTSAPVAAGGASPAPPVDRLLLGSGPAGAEARLTISHGALAGAQIHLRGGALKIEAVVLTQTDSSRHTLGLVMQEVARRLHSRGYVFRASSPASDEPAGRWGQPRDADGPERERRR